MLFLSRRTTNIRQFLEFIPNLKIFRRIRPTEQMVVNFGVKTPEGLRVLDEERWPNVLNRNLVSNKYRQLEAFDNAELPVPDYFLARDLPRDDGDFLLRRFYHTQGRDIIYYKEASDIRESFDYAIRYIEKKSEFRVHVCCGKVISICKKFAPTEQDTAPEVWNTKNGYMLRTYSREGQYREKLGELGLAAVEALKYDFGAVDIIQNCDNAFYLLEVNARPGVTPLRVKAYTEAFMNKERSLTDESLT